MIEQIHIKDFAIIEKLTIPLKEGFNVLTGETGAGKSIIVDAIGVLLKDKVVASDLVKHGKNEAKVEVVLNKVSSEEFDQETLIFKRVFNLQGKSRCYINDSAYTTSTFTRILSKLINIHGQHEHTYLLRSEKHLEFFDTIAGLKEDVKAFNELYNESETLKKETEKLKSELITKKQRAELLSFQINEIKSAKLKESEEEELNEQRNILKNVMKLKELAENSFSLLYGNKNSVYESISKVLSYLNELCKFDPKVENSKSLVESAFNLIEEAVYLLRKTKESYEPDPLTLEKVEERLTLINKLKSKYGNTIREILNYAEEAEKELNSISISEEQLINKEKKLNELKEKVEVLAKSLSEKRKKIAKIIEKEIIEELKFLGFSHALFEIRINEKPLSQDGKDEVEFYFSSNPGQPPKPLSKVASGGELSRLMLALKCVELKLAKKDIKSMTLIFDEIDAGVSGSVAENIGRRLKELAKFHQVLCVTHLPQIAAMADNHLKVEKTVVDEKTVVELRELTESERKQEIARMLSGKITESSLFHAQELLESQ
ncbi:MAG: DNA repair protein RecN [Thermodesulfovibrionaceae bacterium]